MTRTIFLAAVLVSLIMLGCGGANLRAPHEAQLLDNKVLQQRVEAALSRAGSDFENVQVKTDGGTVTLSGTVPSPDARAKAEHISRSIYGVEKTDNKLTIKQPPHQLSSVRPSANFATVEIRSKMRF